MVDTYKGDSVAKKIARLDLWVVQGEALLKAAVLAEASRSPQLEWAKLLNLSGGQWAAWKAHWTMGTYSGAGLPDFSLFGAEGETQRTVLDG